jgi:hypothetical protein
MLHIVNPFPDIAAEALGILTKQEETQGVNAIQDKPVQSNEEQALLVAENSKLELGAVDVPERRKVIKLLNDNDKNVLKIFFKTTLQSRSRKCKMTQERL